MCCSIVSSGQRPAYVHARIKIHVQFHVSRGCWVVRGNQGQQRKSVHSPASHHFQSERVTLMANGDGGVGGWTLGSLGWINACNESVSGSRSHSHSATLGHEDMKISNNRDGSTPPRPSDSSLGITREARESWSVEDDEASCGEYPNGGKATMDHAPNCNGRLNLAHYCLFSRDDDS